MNKYLIIAACIASTSAMAASNNTIRFQGEVADETCTVTINGNSASPTVLLPTVAASALKEKDLKAGETPFTVGVTGCSGASDTDININTIFVANNITATNRIGNTGTAQNVSLELIDANAVGGTILDVTGATGNAGLVLKAKETSAKYDFAVRYVADGVAKSGTVLGSVQYAISYQ